MMRGEEKICIERQKKSDKQPENVHINKKSGERRVKEKWKADKGKDK